MPKWGQGEEQNSHQRAKERWKRNRIGKKQKQKGREAGER